MIRTKLFQSNRTQAIRLPKPVALPEGVREVEISAVGNSRMVSPVGHSWDSFFDGPAVSDDFMAEREQPGPQVRVGF